MVTYSSTQFRQNSVENYYDDSDYYYNQNKTDLGNMGFNIAFGVLFDNLTEILHIDRYFSI